MMAAVTSKIRNISNEAAMSGIHDKKGFTFIETLVVCIIVAILAAAAIPIYIGYVNNQKAVTVNNLAETAAAVANSQWRRGVTIPTGAVTQNTPPLNLYFNGSNYSVTINADATITVYDKNKTTITSTVSYH
jgi:prepilin-type N-terminal cleavage/methylation domain-containing protein